jgi:hypothetical protein
VLVAERRAGRDERVATGLKSHAGRKCMHGSCAWRVDKALNLKRIVDAS